VLPSRAVGVVLVATTTAAILSAAACSTKRGAAPDTAAGIAHDSITSRSATSPDSAHLPSASSTAAATPPPSTGAAAPGCGLVLLNVTVRKASGSAGAAADSALRAEAARILEPVRGLVKTVDYSPAISTFRVHLADTAAPATVDRVMGQLRASRGVDDVSRDECTMHIDRPSTSVPTTRSRPAASPSARHIKVRER